MLLSLIMFRLGEMQREAVSQAGRSIKTRLKEWRACLSLGQPEM